MFPTQDVIQMITIFKAWSDEVFTFALKLWPNLSLNFGSEFTWLLAYGL